MPKNRAFVFTLLVALATLFVSGCDDSGGTSGEEDADVADTASGDTTAPDTAEPDTAEPDTMGCADGETRDCTVVDACGGTQTCDGGAWSECVAPDEVCDGADNDCDGEVDEDFAGLGDACSAGQGACEVTGQVVCTDDGAAVVCSAEAAESLIEVCDGVDNDCDGEVDNVEGLGEACSVGEGICVATGTQICDLDAGSVVCDATEGAPQTEVCDGLDNDCNGTVDDVIGVGDDCSVGTGICAASGTQICDTAAGTLVCDATEGTPGTETCNGLDDDCDGTPDNVAGLGDACSVGTGACAVTGAQICDTAAGALVCDATAGAPGTETCNGVDDDCDGMVDNVAGLGDACSVGTGACAASGMQVCDTAAGTLACSATAGSPGTEICNNVDDDCNGTVDDVANLGNTCTQGTGACENVGTRVCNTSTQNLVCSVTAGTPGTETCNGVDDDCDGTVDDVANLGTSCTVGTGACAVTGVRICDTASGTLVCDATAGSPGTEICDGIDNDCNGTVDDVANLGSNCAQGTGACRNFGTRVCDTAAGTLVCDATPGTPGTEVCNNVDDDCNGTVDDVANLGANCAVGTGACRNFGTRVCDTSAQSLVCDATPGTPGAETCNGIDDDCDGQTDDVAGLGNSCTVGTGACQRSGSRVCDTASQSLVCSASPGSPGTEICNNIDDNCDGQTDNVAGLGNSCTVGTGSCQRTGNRVCNTNTQSLQCDASPGSPSTEVCNNADDDCDGTVDDVAGLGNSCTVGTGACQRSGSRVCNTATQSLVCSASPGSPSSEICNNVDDNCDGNVDNVAGLGQSCTVGTGACQRTGSRVCNTSTQSLQCSAAPGSPGTETCNGVDDDCDGTVDNATVAFTTTNHTADRGCFDLALGDLNGDGRIDIVCAPLINTPTNPDTRIFTYRNQGSGSFAAAQYTPAVAVSPFRTQSDIELGDVDGDGDLDLVAVGQTMKAQVYINNGSGTFAAPYEAFDFTTTGEHGTGGLALADLDGDGDLDIATSIGTIRDGDAWNLAVSRNNGSGSFGTPIISATATDRPNDLVVRNLDSDGDLDLIAVHPDNIKIYRASSAVSYAAPTVAVTLAASSGSDVEQADFNGDGHLDLLVPAVGVRYFIPGTNAGFGTVTSSTVAGTEIAAASGQVDCDGSLEAFTVATNANAPLYYLANPTTLGTTLYIGNTGANTVETADIDNDGDLDVVQGNLDTGVTVRRRN